MGAADEIAVEIAVDLAVEMVVEMAMASATGLHGVALLAANSVEARGMSVETPGRSAAARGVSAVVRGTPWTWPWNAVEVRGHCRDAPPKRQILYISLPCCEATIGMRG